MSGWRIFGTEKDNENADIILDLIDPIEHGRRKQKDGFLYEVLWGYGEPLMGVADPEKYEWVKEFDRAGYYFEMNDTTDTATGIVRFEKGGKLYETEDLVVETDESMVNQKMLDNRQLPEFQMGAPGWSDVYSLLEYWGLPVIVRS